MTSNLALTPVKDHGWMNGFVNLLRKENHSWWGTRAWFLQTLIWIALIDGVTYSEASSARAGGSQSMTPLGYFFLFAGLFPVIGVIILGQEALFEERKAGTAAWVLTKPVSRAAFLFSKLGAYALRMLASMVLVPGIIAYFILKATPGTLFTIPAFLAGLGLVYLLLLYFLALTFMLGGLFRSRGPVIAIPLALMFAANAAMSSWGSLILPWGLAMTFSPEKPALAVVLVQGGTLPSLAPILSCALLVCLFTLIALLRFEREEF